MTDRSFKTLVIRIILMVAILVASLVLWKGVDLMKSSSSEEAPVSSVPSADEVEVIDWTEDRAREAILITLKVIFDPGSELKTISKHLSGGEVSANRLEKFRGEGRSQTAPLLRLEKVRRMQVAAQPVWLARFIDTKGRTHDVSFEADGDRMLLHWEAMVAWGEMSWEALSVEKPKSPIEMRAYLRQIAPEFQPIPIEPGWKAYEVISRDRAFTGIAWVKQDSRPGMILANLSANATHPICARFQYRGSDDNPWLEISSPIHLRWVRLAADR